MNGGDKKTALSLVIDFVKIDWWRRRVLVRWDNKEEEWIDVPSRISIDAFISVVQSVKENHWDKK